MTCNLRYRIIDDWGKVIEDETVVDCCEFLLDDGIIELALIIQFKELLISKTKFIEYYKLMEDLFQGSTTLNEFSNRYEIEFDTDHYKSGVHLLGHLGSLRYVHEKGYDIIPKKFLTLKDDHPQHEAYVYAHLYTEYCGTYTTVDDNIIKSIHELNIGSHYVTGLFCKYVSYFNLDVNWNDYEKDLLKIYTTPKLKDKLKIMEAYADSD